MLFRERTDTHMTRGGNRAGRVGFGFGSGRSGQFDFLEKIGSGRIGSIYMLCFFRSLIDFDWIESHLISGRVEFGSEWVGRVCRIGSGSATSTYDTP
jgi:hypothetical protein